MHFCPDCGEECFCDGGVDDCDHVCDIWNDDEDNWEQE